MNKNNSLEVIKDCTTYIKNHLQDTLTAESLASRYGYSLYHFCHIFKICCDMSPGKYIRLLRLEKAKKDILSGMSITQAGFDNGFETSSGFSKAFRKQNKESEVLIMLHVEIKTLQSQTALGYEIPGEYDSDYSKSGAYWNHINFKEYPAYPEGIHDYGEVGLWTHPDHISGELHYFFGFLTDSTRWIFLPDDTQFLQLNHRKLLKKWRMLYGMAGVTSLPNGSVRKKSIKYHIRGCVLNAIREKKHIFICQ